MSENVEEAQMAEINALGEQILATMERCQAQLRTMIEIAQRIERNMDEAYRLAKEIADDR